MPLILILSHFSAPLAKEARSEHGVKAAFVYNFIRFVEWPEASFPASDSPLVVCVLGKGPVGNEIERLAGRSYHGHPLVIRRPGGLEKLQTCQVLFVCPSERGRLKEILRQVAGWNLLTVSDIRGFAQMGGMINFYKAGNRIRFEANPIALSRADLKASSNLLKLARIVSGETKR